MKTSEEILGEEDMESPNGLKYYHKWTILEKMDEYAEEYAKAFLIWTRNNKTYPMDAQTCLESFKESLKK